MNFTPSKDPLSAIAELEAISRQLSATAEAEDLDAVQQAIDARGRALKELPVAEMTGLQTELAAIYENGELTLASLADLKLHLQAEHARLAQMRDGFWDAPAPVNRLDLRA